MTEQINQTGSFLARGIGLQVIAAIQVVEALGLVGLPVAYLVAGRNPKAPLGSPPGWSLDQATTKSPSDPLWWVDESLFLVFPAILLLTIGWGLWKRRAWARLVALVIHWPTFAGALVLIPLCLLFLLLVPAEGIAVGHVFALFGFIVLPPVLLLSGWTVWYLHRRTLRCVARP